MPTPATANPSAAPTQPANAGFFIPQNATTPVKNLSESPVLSSPSPKGQATPSVNNNKQPSSSKKKILIGLGIVLVILLLLGGAAGLYLTRTSEDNRQQAAVPSGSAQITVSPPDGTFKGGSAQQVDFSLNLSTTPVTLSSIELSIVFSGQIPTDLHFQAQQLQNFLPVNTSIVDSETGKTLKISYQLADAEGFAASSNTVNLGSLTFTSPQSGQLNMRFNASESKVILQQSGVDILRPPSLVAYTFEPVATPTPLENEVIDDASGSANASRSASLNSLSDSTIEDELSGTGGASPSATPTTALLAQVNTTVTVTPTRTPTPTLTPTITSALTPTPTTARQSSLPADTQETPVSGSVDVTYTLIGSGLLLIASGFYLLPKKRVARSQRNSRSSS